jgi:hypothetical protein
MPLLTGAAKLVWGIIEIVRQKGIDGAGKIRLEELPGWKEWSQELLQKEAKSHFIDKLQEYKKRGGADDE